MRSLPALLFAVLAACGGAQSSPEPAVDLRGACVVDPEAAAGRVAAPEAPGACDDPAIRAEWQAACDTGDAIACHQDARCILVATLDRTPGDPAYTELVDAATSRLRVGCAGGIAESCVVVGSLAEESILADGEHPRRAEWLDTMCEGYREACRRGVEADGCARCTTSGCSGLPGATPGPFKER
jgi:hypothetical protein